MMERLRLRLRGVFSRLRRPQRRVRKPAAKVKGCVQNVIVIRPSDKRFREAVFILQEDYLLSPDADRRQLLQEAREAAQDYTASLLPTRRRFPYWLLLSLLLAAAVVALKLLGVF